MFIELPNTRNDTVKTVKSITRHSNIINIYKSILDDLKNDGRLYMVLSNLGNNINNDMLYNTRDNETSGLGMITSIKTGVLLLPIHSMEILSSDNVSEFNVTNDYLTHDYNKIRLTCKLPSYGFNAVEYNEMSLIVIPDNVIDNYNTYYICNRVIFENDVYDRQKPLSINGNLHRLLYTNTSNVSFIVDTLDNREYNKIEYESGDIDYGRFTIVDDKYSLTKSQIEMLFDSKCLCKSKIDILFSMGDFVLDITQETMIRD